MGKKWINKGFSRSSLSVVELASVDGVGLAPVMFPGWWSLCLRSGWWGWIWSLWRPVSSVGFGASMGAVCLWAAVVAFKVLGTLLPQLLQSGRLSITAVPPAPYLPPGSLPVLPFPFPPCAAGRRLLGRCLRGSFRVAATRVGFAHPLRRGASADLFRLPVPVLCIAGVGALLSSHCLHSLSRGVICSSSGCAEGLRALPKLASRPSVGTPGCPLPRCVCPPATWARPLCCKGCVRPLGLSAAPLSVPEPVWGHSPREVQLSLFTALQVPALPDFPRLRSSPLGPPVREIPSARELLLQGSLPPLGHKLLPRNSPSFLFFMFPFSLLLHWRPGVFRSLEVAL